MAIHKDTILDLLLQPCVRLADVKQGMFSKTWEVAQDDQVIETFTASVEVSNMVGRLARKAYLAGVRDAVEMHNRLLGHGKEVTT
jgi:3-hydroxyacyl-CoA dehydrogenase